eukprot:348966-Rhodomonas_salina.1
MRELTTVSVAVLLPETLRQQQTLHGIAHTHNVSAKLHHAANHAHDSRRVHVFLQRGRRERTGTAVPTTRAPKCSVEWVPDEQMRGGSRHLKPDIDPLVPLELGEAREL